MTLMKDAPLPTFGKNITEIAREALGGVAEKFCLNSSKTDQRVVKVLLPFGDYIVGKKVVGTSFEGFVFVCAERKMLQFLKSCSVAGESVGANDDHLFSSVFQLFSQLAQKRGCVLSSPDKFENDLEKNCVPEEWLESRMTSEHGSCWLSFGYSGKLPFAAEEELLSSTEAKNMTFF